MPRIGLMVETPAAVYQAYEMAKRVDFMSVGSNDLIQYLLAVDRNNPQVAATYTAYHPAVLRSLQQAVKSCHKAKKPITICGEMASDPIMVILLLAMGFNALSMSPRSLLRVKWVIRKFTLERAKSVLKQILKMDDPVEIRNHLEMVVEEHGLAGLIRAGKS
jgi:phosphotransferase system enzyme I (PtsP)